MSLPDFALITLYSLGLKQLIFDYKKTVFIREFLHRTALKELVSCVYCQAIECAVLALILRPYTEPVLVVLSVGFVAIALDAQIFKSIAMMEEIRNFEVNHEDQARDEGTTEEGDLAS